MPALLVAYALTKYAVPELNPLILEVKAPEPLPLLVTEPAMVGAEEVP